MSSVIEVKELCRHFGPVQAVNGISFTVEKGEVLGFLGPNGAGKSTTMKMITGFLSPSGGTIAVCGHDVTAQPIEAKARIGYLPEGAPAYGEMTPANFLSFIADIRGIQEPQKSSRIAEVVRTIHLESVIDRPIETLSKGFKRRVGMAQAILHDPDVLIMDEPTDGLDPNQKHEVRTLIKEMAKNKAIVISTHILEEVDAVCDRAIIIADGELVFCGTPAELEAKSRFHNAVLLSLKNDNAADAQKQLETINDVSAVEQVASHDGMVKLRVLPRNGQSIASHVGKVIHANNWELDEFYVETGRLDEVFRSITMDSGREVRT